MSLKKIVNPLITFCGFIALFLGLLGIPLPLLPTTPFLLLAAFCFAKSSPRFHAWLLNHRLMGSPIKQWQEDKSVRRKTKIVAVSSVIVTFSISIYLVGKMPLQIMLLTMACCCLFFILRLAVRD